MVYVNRYLHVGIMYQRATVFPIIFSLILELVVFFEKIIMSLSLVSQRDE